MILEEKCLLIMIMILISSISAQKCKKPKVQRFVFCGPVVRISSGQCGGLHPGQAVPVPRAGLHLGQQEGRGLGPVPCSVSCPPAMGSVVCSSVALGAAAACIMERCMKSGQALNTTLMAVSRLFGTWIALRLFIMSVRSICRSVLHMLKSLLVYSVVAPNWSLCYCPNFLQFCKIARMRLL